MNKKHKFYKMKITLTLNNLQSKSINLSEKRKNQKNLKFLFLKMNKICQTVRDPVFWMFQNRWKKDQYSYQKKLLAKIYINMIFFQISFQENQDYGDALNLWWAKIYKRFWRIVHKLCRKTKRIVSKFVGKKRKKLNRVKKR